MRRRRARERVQAHLELAQRFFGSFARKDLDGVRACLAPDVAWIVPGLAAISGRHEGPEGVLGYFARLREFSGGTWRAEPLDMFAGATGVVVVARGAGEREGRRFDATYCLRLRMENGRIVEGRLYPEDLHAFEAFWR